MEKKLPVRPEHTGSAKVQAQAQNKNSHRAETKRPREYYRRARRPLILEDGNTAVALRQTEGGSVEVKVQTRSGQSYWREVQEFLSWGVIRSWVREGF